MNRSLNLVLFTLFCRVTSEESCKFSNDLSKKFGSMDAQVRMMEDTLRGFRMTLEETHRFAETDIRQISIAECSKNVKVACTNITCPKCPSLTCPKHPTIVREGQNSTLPTDCSGYLERGSVKSGIYKVLPFHYSVDKPIDVLCDMETDGGGWTVFQRRDDFGEPREDFFRNWTDYKRGFGDLNEEFWLGNDNLFALTNQQKMSLRVDLADFEGERRYAKYQDFLMKSEGEKYEAIFRGFTGTAGDSLAVHSGKPFSTKDRDNGDHPTGVNCAQAFKGAWWYTGHCHTSNLNGAYLKGESTHGVGINWYTWRGFTYSLKLSEMKFRPKSFRPPS